MSHIPIYNDDDFAQMREAGRLAAEVLDMITEHVVPGAITEELDARMHQFILDNGATPAPLGYKGYPKATCISVNHVVCHGIPSQKALKEGDIVNIDTTVILDGWYGDTSRMFIVGDVDKAPVIAQRLVDVTYQCLMKAIDICAPGVHLGDIGAKIQEIAEAERFGVVRDFCGHGIGRSFHTEPQILHYGKAGTGITLEKGMIFTIEPMINAGTWQTKVLPDGWTAVTKDRKLSAQFEHSLGITDDGVEIFTLSPKGFTQPPYN